ncbi:Uncharacterised protein [Mycobacteroides abscessus subsp. massiliense]|nr:Uncharacterised protein [Mycobacteroides abscessus subsp. massiliense]
MNGTIHTQWWVHEMGEMSRPNICTTQIRPNLSSTARQAKKASTAVTRYATSTSAPEPASWPRILEIPPRQDWSTAMPTSTVSTKTTAAQMAVAQRRAPRK